MKTKCNGCGVELENIEGETDPYQCSTAACWTTYNQLMAKEFSGPEYFVAHRLTVDAYMTQHPSNISRASVQSIWVHLIALYLTLEKQMSSQFVSRVMAKITAPKIQFEWLTPPDPNTYKIRVKDLMQENTPEEYTELAIEWAKDVWNAWNEHHTKIRQLANQTLSEMK
jgi:hypothetical protein